MSQVCCSQESHAACFGGSYRPVALGERIGERLAALLLRYRAWRAKRATYLSLQALSDRSLADIGLTRSEIGSVVYGRRGERVQAHDDGWMQSEAARTSSERERPACLARLLQLSAARS